jgi:hypothetical protein
MTNINIDIIYEQFPTIFQPTLEPSTSQPKYSADWIVGRVNTSARYGLDLSSLNEQNPSNSENLSENKLSIEFVNSTNYSVFYTRCFQKQNSENKNNLSQETIKDIYLFAVFMLKNTINNKIHYCPSIVNKEALISDKHFKLRCITDTPNSGTLRIQKTAEKKLKITAKNLNQGSINLQTKLENEKLTIIILTFPKKMKQSSTQNPQAPQPKQKKKKNRTNKTTPENFDGKKKIVKVIETLYPTEDFSGASTIKCQKIP